MSLLCPFSRVSNLKRKNESCTSWSTAETLVGVFIPTPTLFYMFICGEIQATHNLLSRPFVSVQFNRVENIHVVCSPSLELFILQNWNLHPKNPNSHPSAPWALATSILLSVPMNWTTQGLHISGIILSVCDRLVSLSMKFSRFIHAVTCVMISFFVVAKQYSIVHTHHTVLTHSWINRHLSCFFHLFFAQIFTEGLLWASQQAQGYKGKYVLFCTLRRSYYGSEYKGENSLQSEHCELPTELKFGKAMNATRTFSTAQGRNRS